MKTLTINKKRCRGLYICQKCESIYPGIVCECESEGHVTLREWTSEDPDYGVDRLIEICPEKAIIPKAMVVDEEKETA